MKIRKATEKDAKRILELFKSDSNLLGYSGEKFTLGEIKNYIKEKIDSVIVCEIDGKIVGVISSEIWKDYCYLAFMVVDKKYRHHGIGEEMLKNLEANSKKEGYIGLYVKEKNTPMIKLLREMKYKSGDKFVYYHKDLQ